MARVAFVICGDPEATRDAVQTAWKIAWRRLHTLRDPGQVRAWLIAIAANEARQTIRGRRRRPVVDISNALQHDAGDDPADAIDNVAVAVHDGKAYVFGFRDPAIHAASYPTDRATFVALLKSLRFPD